MILLDTNVMSEIAKQAPDARLLTWLDRQQQGTLWTTAVNIFEVRSGLERLPHGRRRVGLEEAFKAFLGDILQDRVAALDVAAAEAAARLAARRQAVGRPIEFRDTLIAGVAISRGAILATRNVRHFADLATSVVDPWAEGRT